MIRNILFFLTIASALKIYSAFEENLKFLSDPPALPDFDMYVFSIQWGATLCHTGNQKCDERLKSIPKNIFTLHGLWPNNSNGKKVDKCNPGNEIKITKDSSQIFDEMETFWISFTHDDNSFWSHEFNTHGYCYTQKYHIEDPLDYFGYALGIYKRHELGNLFLKAFENLTGSHEFELMDLNHHVAKVTGDLKYEFVCRYYQHKQYLQEIRFFFDLNLNSMDIGRKGDCNPDKPIHVDFQ